MTTVYRIEQPNGHVSGFVLGHDRQRILRSWWPQARLVETEACGFDIGAGWGPWRCGNPEPCAEHATLACGCGRPAVRLCSHAGSLVCGRPVCEGRVTCPLHGHSEDLPG